MSNVKSLPGKNGAAPQDAGPDQVIPQLEQAIAQQEQQIEQARANYANSYLSLAKELVVSLVAQGMKPAEAIAAGFESMHAFRVTGEVEIPKLKALADIPTQMLQNKEEMKAFLMTQRLAKKAHETSDNIDIA